MTDAKDPTWTDIVIDVDGTFAATMVTVGGDFNPGAWAELSMVPGTDSESRMHEIYLSGQDGLQLDASDADGATSLDGLYIESRTEYPDRIVYLLKQRHNP